MNFSTSLRLNLVWLAFMGALAALSLAAPSVAQPASAAPAHAGCNQTPYPAQGPGANQSGPFNDTCTGAPSMNGNGNGQATGRPCAGCVGNADEKNPPGQLRHNHDAGYECARNKGIGRTNPAHTGCTTTVTPPPPPPPPNCVTNCGTGGRGGGSHVLASVTTGGASLAAASQASPAAFGGGTTLPETGAGLEALMAGIAAVASGLLYRRRQTKMTE